MNTNATGRPAAGLALMPKIFGPLPFNNYYFKHYKSIIITMPIFSSVQLQLKVQTYWANLGSLFLAVDYSTAAYGKLSSMCGPKILMINVMTASRTWHVWKYEKSTQNNIKTSNFVYVISLYIVCFVLCLSVLRQHQELLDHPL